MVKSFKESHAKDLEKLAADRQRQAEKKATEDLVNAPQHTVLSMAGLTSAVWTLGMFQMVTGESCQCIQRTKQTEPCQVGVRHAACTVPKCGFVIRYQNTSNLEHDETHSEGEDSDGREHVQIFRFRLVRVSSN